MFLWTHTAVNFYRRLGYMPCEKVSLHRACLQTLERKQLDGLERMLSLRLGSLMRPPPSAAAAASASAATSAIGGRPGGDSAKPPLAEPPSHNFSEHVAGEGDVWLKKRLVESVGSQPVPRDRLVAEMTDAAVVASRAVKRLSRNGPAGEEDGEGSSGAVQWEYVAVAVPWQKQIGPSCGLAALRMVRDYFVDAHSRDDDIGGASGQAHAASTATAHKQPSLLQAARDAGCSTDGEVFDAAALRKLAETVCGLRCEMRSLAATTPDDLVQVLSSGGCFIVPYDSHPGTRLPSLNEGRNAHYGVIMGVLFASADDSDRVDVDSTAMHTNEDTPSGAVNPDDGIQGVEAGTKVSLCEYKGGAVPTRSDEVLVVVLHSMSQRLCIAPLTEFVASNAQLTSVDDSRFASATLNLADRLVACTGLAE